MGEGGDRERADDAGEGVHVQRANMSVQRDEDPAGHVCGNGHHAGVERALGEGRSAAQAESGTGAHQPGTHGAD
jgi:hypothetical protein